MYQVLIVDDEMLAVRGIISGINWEKSKIDKVHSAYNIRKAKETFINNNIDIMICDIEMPQGNGIELLKWVRKNYPDTISVFLTCHADFSYAQQAIQLGAMDYILKPMDPENLKSILEKAIMKIEKNRNIQELFKHYYELWSNHQPLMAEKFWLSFLDTQDLSEQELSNLAKDYGIEVNKKSTFIPLILSIKGKLNFFEDKVNIEHKLLKLSENVMFAGDKDRGIVLPLKSRVLLTMLKVDDSSISDEEIENLSKELIEKALVEIECDVTCFIGEIKSLCELRNEVSKLIEMDSYTIACRKKVYHSKDQIDKKQILEVPSMDNWSELFFHGEKEKIIIYLNNAINSMYNQESINVDVINSFYQNFLQIIYFSLKKKNIRVDSIFLTDEIDDGVLSMYSKNEFLNWTISIVVKTIGALLEKPKTLIDEVKDYIEKNLTNELSREFIASAVNLSPDYLTKQFKKETNQSLSEYIIYRRISLAKELLISSDMPVGEIVNYIGYSNFSYFSKIFKKDTGFKPLDYRKNKRLIQ